MSDKIRVLHVLAGGKIGGAERSLEWFMQSTDKNEFDHEFVFLYFGGVIQSKLADMGFFTSVLRWRNGFSVVGRQQLIKLISKCSPNIIHFHETTPLVKVFVKYVFPHIPLILTCHGVEWNSIVSKYGQLLDDKFIDFVICNSDYTLSTYKNVYRRILNIKKIYLGLNLEKYRALMRREIKKHPANTPSDLVEIIYLGRVEEYKGVMDLPVLALELQNIGLYNFRIQIVGSGSAEEKLRNTINSFQLKNKISFLGSHEDVLPYLAAANILVFPSWWEEPFGLVLLEALACGLSVVGYRSGGSPEILDAAPGAVLVEKKNVKQMALSIADIIEAGAYPNISDCIYYLEKKFNNEKTTQEFQNLYEDLAGKLS